MQMNAFRNDSKYFLTSPQQSLRIIQMRLIASLLRKVQALFIYTACAVGILCARRTNRHKIRKDKSSSEKFEMKIELVITADAEHSKWPDGVQLSENDIVMPPIYTQIYLLSQNPKEVSCNCVSLSFIAQKSFNSTRLLFVHRRQRSHRQSDTIATARNAQSAHRLLS